MVRSVTKSNPRFIGSLTVAYFFSQDASPFGTFNLKHRTVKPKAWQGLTDRTKLRNYGPIPLSIGTFRTRFLHNNNLWTGLDPTKS